jgi:hypothetical protein
VLQKRAIELLQVPAVYDMGHTEYDAAWIARVPLQGTNQSAFPEVLRVVKEPQAPDGGWAPDINYISARILATLALVIER